MVGKGGLTLCRLTKNYRHSDEFLKWLRRIRRGDTSGFNEMLMQFNEVPSSPIDPKVPRYMTAINRVSSQLSSLKMDDIVKKAPSLKPVVFTAWSSQYAESAMGKAVKRTQTLIVGGQVKSLASSTCPHTGTVVPCRLVADTLSDKR